MAVPCFSELPRVGGTLVWYFSICHREVWFMSHGIEPDREDDFLVMGRLIDANSYRRDRHSVSFGDNRFDIVKVENGTLVVGEVKKSSRSIDAARLQLAHYLYDLWKDGIIAKGQLLFPKEKRREEVELTEEIRHSLDGVYEEIREIACMATPPKAVKNRFCSVCAYSDLCWS